MNLTLSEFLNLHSLQRGIQKMVKNKWNHIQVSIPGVSQKIFLTNCDLTQLKPAKGFSVEQIKESVFVVIPKEISLVKN